MPGRQSGMRQVDASQNRSKEIGGSSYTRVPMGAEWLGVGLIHLHMMLGALGLREHCPSVPGKDPEGAREMTSYV